MPMLDNQQMTDLLSEVRSWLTEEKSARVQWCRLAKLELLMKWGQVTPQEAIDAWELSAQHEK